MLNTLAQRPTDVLLLHGAIENSRRPIFVYGFELLLSTSFSILSIVIISAYLSQLSAALTSGNVWFDSCAAVALAPVFAQIAEPSK